MILRPKRKFSVEYQTNETKTEKKVNTLPPDEYEPMFEPTRFLVRESESRSTGLPFRQYIELEVKRYDDDEALPFVWMSMYQESEFYTGYLKGKSVHFPVKNLNEVIGYLVELERKCYEKKIEE